MQPDGDITSLLAKWRPVTANPWIFTLAGLALVLYWWLPALALTTGYFVFLDRRFAGKLPPEAD